MFLTLAVLPSGRQGAKDFLGGMGLGMLAGPLADLKLGELLDTPPPGLDEAVAIAKARRCFFLEEAPFVLWCQLDWVSCPGLVSLWAPWLSPCDSSACRLSCVTIN